MIAGELKNKIDRIWDAFWSGGISNPLEVIEQITYLLFIRRLDDLQTLAERKANRPASRSSARSPASTWSCPPPRSPVAMRHDGHGHTTGHTHRRSEAGAVRPGRCDRHRGPGGLPALRAAGRSSCGVVATARAQSGSPAG